jgi:D-sedoheptulose 7-phosphate isomerase
MKDIVHQEAYEHIRVAKSIFDLSEDIVDCAQLCIDCLKNGGKILLFGNGGSASDAQHIAAELVGRYKTERRGLSAIAITTDTSIITSIGNDFGYNKIFSRQVEAIANEGDLLIGISTSGKSANVINALKLAKKIKCTSIGMSGRDGGEMNKICNINLVISSDDTARIQEMHILIGHIICNLIDQKFKD